MTSTLPRPLRVAAPTLEPDPALLAMLAEASASSHSVGPRTVRPAGLRMLVAAASVAAIATATWAGGQNAATPLKPVAPASQVPTSSPTNGDVGTPQPDVATTPDSPMSPGLSGTTSPDAKDAVDGTGSVLPGRSADKRQDKRGDQQRTGKGKGRGTANRPRLSDAAVSSGLDRRSSSWLGSIWDLLDQPDSSQRRSDSADTRGQGNGPERRSTNRRGRN